LAATTPETRAIPRVPRTEIKAKVGHELRRAEHGIPVGTFVRTVDRDVASFLEKWEKWRQNSKMEQHLCRRRLFPFPYNRDCVVFQTDFLENIHARNIVTFNDAAPREPEIQL
jgi:hypothetical protein